MPDCLDFIFIDLWIIFAGLTKDNQQKLSKVKDGHNGIPDGSKQQQLSSLISWVSAPVYVSSPGVCQCWVTDSLPRTPCTHHSVAHKIPTKNKKSWKNKPTYCLLDNGELKAVQNWREIRTSWTRCVDYTGSVHTPVGSDVNSSLACAAWIMMSSVVKPASRERFTTRPHIQNSSFWSTGQADTDYCDQFSVN